MQNKIKFRMDRGQLIRDGSGRYACPNLYCWRAYMTGIKAPDVKDYVFLGDEGYKETVVPRPKCGVELDWSWIINDIQTNNRHMDSSKE